MHILYLNHNLREHGTYFRALHMAREMVRRGHPATLLTASPAHWYRPVEGTVDGVRVIETPSRTFGVAPDDGWGPIDVAWRLARVLRRPCDLVYAFAHPPNVYLPALAAKLLRRKPLVVDWCDAYRDGIFPLRRRLRAEAPPPAGLRQRLAERIEERWLERGILNSADRVTVISRALADAARAAGVDDRRLLLLPSGAPVDTIQPMDKLACREALGIAPGGPILGFVTNYHPDEAFFLQAIARAFRSVPAARLLMAGPPFSTALVRRHALADRILPLGRLPFDRMPVVLGASDVLALPLADTDHNRCRWPNKFGDYIAAARPVAANAIGDIAPYFLPGDDAIGRAAPCDAAAYGDAIAELLAAGPAAWDAMGRAARHLAETDLSWPRLAQRLEAFLAPLAAGQTAPVIQSKM